MTTIRNQSNRGFALSIGMLAILLLLGVSQVQAASSRGFDNGEWRLGDHNQIFLNTDRGWRRVQGSATDVGDGWVIGTDRRSGGFGIYRWNGRRFDRMPGGAVEIGGSYNNPWVINNRGERFEWSGHDWRAVRGFGPRRDERYEEPRRGDNRRDDDFRNDSHREDLGREDLPRDDQRRRSDW